MYSEVVWIVEARQPKRGVIPQTSDLRKNRRKTEV
jgi:hypothetical protein